MDFWIVPFFRRDADDVFHMLRGVKVVQSLMAGVDWILPWLPTGLVLCDGRGIHDISTSEWVLTPILASLTRFPEYRDLQARGEWRRREKLDGALVSPSGSYPVLGDELAGKTVLIVGYGSIGKAVETRLLPFGVHVVRVARTAKDNPIVHATEDLRGLLPDAHIVVIVVPMVSETQDLVGAEEMALMRHGALPVNAARGRVVDTAALLNSLISGKLSAALDVTDPETLPQSHPLWHAPNCLGTPHTVGSAVHSSCLSTRRAQVERFLAGEPLENVVEECGY